MKNVECGEDDRKLCESFCAVSMFVKWMRELWKGGWVRSVREVMKSREKKKCVQREKRFRRDESQG